MVKPEKFKLLSESRLVRTICCIIGPSLITDFFLIFFQSVMHYPNHAFSKNDEVTLEAINDPSIRFGQRKMMTCGDAETVNRLYRCHVPFKVSLCNHHARKYGILRQDHYDEPEVHKKFRNLFEGYPIDDGDDK